jgi:hypothetical protein
MSFYDIPACYNFLMMYTKKSRFINALSTLTENQKEELKSFFSKYPVYESRINWNSKDLQYTDFSRVFELAENYSKNRKRKTCVSHISETARQ